jgi:hypothetical protein
MLSKSLELAVQAGISIGQYISILKGTVHRNQRLTRKTSKKG